MRGFLALAGLSLLFSSCAQKPTQVFETRDVKTLTRPDLKAPIQITEKTVVIDARDAFNFSMAHIARSVNLQWREFSQRKAPFTGLLQDDLFFHARRLARLGVTPEADVLVLGAGLEGEGEEGRLAWTLYYMGVKNVRYAAVNMFRVGWTNQTGEKPYESRPIWKPVVQESVWVKRDELSTILGAKPGGYFKSGFKKPELGGHGPVIIDVRSESEFLSKNLDFDIATINIEWKEFFTKLGRPDPAIVAKLKAVGITPDRRIVLISNQGVRSAAVTMALLDLGFMNAGNYAGGYAELGGR